MNLQIRLRLQGCAQAHQRERISTKVEKVALRMNGHAGIAFLKCYNNLFNYVIKIQQSRRPFQLKQF